MNSWIKTAGLVILAVSLAACSDDDRAVPVKKAPAADDGAGGAGGGSQKPDAELIPEAEVLRSESSMFDNQIVDPAAYHFKISIPDAEGKQMLEYTRSVNEETLSQTSEGGSEAMKPFLNGTENSLARVQTLDQNAQTLILSVYNDDTLTDGRAYVFVKDEQGQMKFTTELSLDKNNSDVSVVALIRQFAAGEGLTASQAIEGMVQDDKFFYMVNITNDAGDEVFGERL